MPKPFTVHDLPALLDTVPPGAYVAISVDEGRIIAFNQDYKRLHAELDAQGVHCPLLVRRPLVTRAMAL